MSNNIINKYTRICNRIVQWNDNNKRDVDSLEDDYLYQDKIYQTFINDICSEKIKNYDQIKKIAKMLKKNVIKKEVVYYDY